MTGAVTAPDPTRQPGPQSGSRPEGAALTLQSGDPPSPRRGSLETEVADNALHRVRSACPSPAGRAGGTLQTVPEPRRVPSQLPGLARSQLKAPWSGRWPSPEEPRPVDQGQDHVAMPALLHVPRRPPPINKQTNCGTGFGDPGAGRAGCLAPPLGPEARPRAQRAPGSPLPGARAWPTPPRGCFQSTRNRTLGPLGHRRRPSRGGGTSTTKRPTCQVCRWSHGTAVSSQ